MIILDTNVVSEPMRPLADRRVVAWIDRQVADSLFLTATNLAELLVGIEVLPKGRRKDGLSAGLEALIHTLFGPRILPFGELAAVRYASLVAQAKERGRSVQVADAQIAAIAAVHGFSVATRDAAPFEALGIPVINPWE